MSKAKEKLDRLRQQYKMLKEEIKAVEAVVMKENAFNNLGRKLKKANITREDLEALNESNSDSIES